MSRTLPAVLAFLGLALAAGGVGVFWLANRRPVADIGWTAYAPLEPGDAYQSRITFLDGWAVFWTGGHLLGAGLLVLGLLVLTGAGGWALGRRSAQVGT